MLPHFRLFVYLALVIIVFPTLVPGACTTSTCLPDGTQASGAVYRICMPETSCWNGKLVVYSHGYVAYNEPVGIPEDQVNLPDGTSIPGLVNSLGYGFAMSSYRTNGLAVLPGVQDQNDVVSVFSQVVAPPSRTYMAGVSEGGIVTALSLEQYSGIYNAGLATCGPIGSFQKQIGWVGDFRVVFDYFFPGVIPGAGTSIPQSVIDNWDTVYKPAVEAAIAANPSATQQLLSVTGAPVSSDPDSIRKTTTGILWYNVFGTNDAVQKLGGQPYDNSHKIYRGSSNDLALNQGVARFTADPQALQTVAANYETTGLLVNPVVTLHTTGDPIVPFFHEPIYAAKALTTGSGSKLSVLPADAYGHCQFTTNQVLLAFLLMVVKDAGHPLAPGWEQVLPASERQAFLNQARAMGLIRP